MMRLTHNMALSRSQRGVTLLVGLIMLVLATLLVLATFHLGRSNLDIVTNVQQRDEGLGAAQQTIEAAVNSPLLTTNPAAIFTTPCPAFSAANPNTLCYDVNNDGVDDVKVEITPPPTCVKAKPILTTDPSLKYDDPNDQPCATQVSQQSFGVGGPSNNSNCSSTVWDIRAVARTLDPSGTAVAGQGAAPVVNQGVALRVGTDQVATSCP
jgi:Tfp pilus assembly protein PilX